MKQKFKLEKYNKLIGGHVSIRDHIYFAPERANSFNFNTFQIFVKSNMQWKKNDNLLEDDFLKFKENTEKYGIKKTVAHASYLINLASENEELLKKSIDDVKYELELCNKLEINYMVIHPGSNSDKKNAMKNIMNILNNIDYGYTELLIENSSGKGNTLPGSVEEMVEMLDYSKNINLCLDVCHFFSYGYNIRDEYNEVMDNLFSMVNRERIKVLHLNDSKYDAGEKKDRHENIGYGYIGDKGFYNLMNDNNFNNIPMIMETPDGDNYYIKNLSKLLEFIGE